MNVKRTDEVIYVGVVGEVFDELNILQGGKVYSISTVDNYGKNVEIVVEHTPWKTIKLDEEVFVEAFRKIHKVDEFDATELFEEIESFNINSLIDSYLIKEDWIKLESLCKTYNITK